MLVSVKLTVLVAGRGRDGVGPPTVVLAVKVDEVAWPLALVAVVCGFEVPVPRRCPRHRWPGR